MPATPVALSWPELVAGLAGLLIVANAARRGFLREGSLLLGLGLALWLAGQLFRPLGLLVLHQERGGPWGVALYAALALALLVAIAGLSSLAAPLVRRGPLLGLDRLAGAAVGLAECALFVGLLALAGDRLGLLRPAPASPLARAADLVGATFGRLATAVPPEVLASLQPH